MVKKILFLCVANSARSQMAEGLAKNILQKAFIINSAGSKPSEINPYAIKVMNEIGIDISNQSSKSVDEFNLNEFNYIVTLCAEEICPYINSSKAYFLHWPFFDPANKSDSPEESINKFRNVRDEIGKKIKNFKWE
ncbi:arsenate reductase ArsC [Pigmentibacter sp. JX0631]|uniref:arsenate reductase ArsC n=1 Tax=Pigmentibacter sp. JX0631 TaxID=2976982 RepID=UPI002468D769|nr:arsenate reductase ArsC [Pigmentibacter sp. JX0631]WGL59848.1 arsenate reductase ArsC [Pigmentibacter sp. JX0631]